MWKHEPAIRALFLDSKIYRLIHHISSHHKHQRGRTPISSRGLIPNWVAFVPMLSNRSMNWEHKLQDNTHLDMLGCCMFSLQLSHQHKEHQMLCRFSFSVEFHCHIPCCKCSNLPRQTKHPPMAPTTREFCMTVYPWSVDLVVSL